MKSRSLRLKGRDGGWVRNAVHTASNLLVQLKRLLTGLATVVQGQLWYIKLYGRIIRVLVEVIAIYIGRL